MSKAKVQRIDCQHCGDSIRTKRPDRRKWCDVCKVLKGLIALRKKVHKCVVCDSQYFAWSSDTARARVKVCAACEQPGRDAEAGRECVRCHGNTNMLPGLKLCYPCATQAEDEKATAITTKVLYKALAERKHG